MKNFLELASSAGVQGFLHCNEAHRLVELAAGREVLEVGSFRGLSAFLMGFVAERLVCVDTFRANSAGQTQMDTVTTLGDFQHAVRHYNHVQTFVGTSEAAAASPAIVGTFDFIFLDAMHTYEDVKADIARWWPRLRPGGQMAFHDYGHHDFPGVQPAVDEALGAPDGVEITLAWYTRR